MKNGGWFWPLNLKKAHYFIDGRSLCGSYLTFAKQFEQDNHNSGDNCARCKKIREKLFANPKLSQDQKGGAE